MSYEQLANVIQGPVVTEKSHLQTDDNNTVVLKVKLDSNKKQIKAAAEKFLGVKVLNVNTAKMKGKQKTFGRLQGRRSDWKKAYVKLAPGEDISFTNMD